MTGKKILIVDDNPAERQLIIKALEENGYQLMTAVDGEDALTKIASEQPDLVILDIILPKRNGFQVCRQLKTGPNTYQIKIIMLSSQNRECDRFWGLRQGADDYMVKPIEGESLRATVARQLAPYNIESTHLG